MNIQNSDVLVIVPAYNEGEVLLEVMNSLKNAGFSVLCINDASNDGTEKILELAKIEFLSHKINLGQGASLETGFQAIRDGLFTPKLVATFDADGQHQVSDLESFLKLFEIQEDLEFVIGSRFLSNVDVPLVKKVILKSFAKLARITIGIKVSDRHNGLRMFKTYLLSTLKLDTPGYGHADEFLRYIAKRKVNYREYPTRIIYSEYSVQKGQSTINGFKMIFDSLVNGR